MSETRRDRELCAKCNFTYAGHISNTGVLYPCWTPSGKYAPAPRAPEPERPVCPACGSRRVHPTEGNAVGNAMDCSVCGNDFTPPSADATAGERDPYALTDERLFLDAAEKYAEQARELRELFNDPKMGEPSSERAQRFYALAKAAAARSTPPAACAECLVSDDAGRRDTERLDYLDTLASGITINSTATSESMSMTPKAQGFSHTRDLIDQHRKRYAAARSRCDGDVGR